jgi:serine/threonine protein phosphatase PrpC
MQCAECSTDLPEDDVFCEECGARLPGTTPPPPIADAACKCGAPANEIGEDGYCNRCGRLARRPESDHIEIALSPDCAAVCDRGVRHPRNEDRVALEQAGNGYALVVCDGVSSSRESELASSTVSTSVTQSLAHVLNGALNTGAGHDPESAMRQAIAAAGALLAEHPPRRAGDNPPSTTVAAAMVADGEVTIGWVGDSRVYWIDAGGARQLTTDHSWMNDVISSGMMTAEQALKAPEAHGITRWLGADAGENATPDIVRLRLAPPGTLLVCSDGLWNYAQEPETMARLVNDAVAGSPDALEAARKLVEFANAQGGQDNVTAIVLRCGAPREASEEAPKEN